MARYATHHKEATRQRIVHTAGRRLKASGLAGAGVSALMTDAGLTNGAFYVHFASKDELITTVVGGEIDAQRDTAAAVLTSTAGLEGLVSDYLSAQHRDHPGEGCPSAALIEDIARGDAALRQTYTRGIVDFVDLIAVFLDPAAPHTQRVRVLAAFAGMVGTLQMARTVTDRGLSDALLTQGIDQALVLLGVRPRTHLSVASDPEAHASTTRDEQP